MHPVLDEPYEHLQFEDDGTIIAKNNSKKGELSILHYGLSNWEKRGILILDRKEIIENVRKRVRNAVNDYTTNEMFYKQILTILFYLYSKQATQEIEKTQEKRSNPHSSVYKTCIERFETFFIEQETIYTPHQKQLLHDALNAVREKTNNS